MLAFVTAAALAFGPVQQADTTFAVAAGGTLELNTHGGSVEVDTWDRDAIRITTARGDGSRVRVRTSGATVRVDAESRRGGPANGDYRITLPRRFGVRVDGVNVSVNVQDMTGAVRVDNVEGAINVRNVTGAIRVESVSGGVSIDDVRGNVHVSTVNQSVRLDRVNGDIAAETVNGGITMRGAQSAQVRASTVNGYVEYNGVVRNGGSYYLGAHNGRITMSLAEDVNASVTVATNSGRVEAAFPVMVRPGSLGGSPIQITLGSGSATVELHSFNGTVHLVRPTGR